MFGLDLVSTGIGAISATAGQAILSRWREHRPHPAGLADLLQWGFLIDEGVVLQKDGALLAGWHYRGPDLDAATREELAQLTRHVNDALCPLTDIWMIHVDAIRRPARPYPACVFPNAISAVIDEERRTTYDTNGAHHETEYVLTATYLPPADVFSRVGGWFMQRNEATPSANGVDWSQALTTYQTTLRALEQRLSAVLTIERLSSTALLTHLHRCLTGLDHPIQPPTHGCYLNTVLADQEFVGGFEPRMGAYATRTIAVHGYPQTSRVGHLDQLGALPYSFRWSTRILPLSQPVAAKLIKRHQLTWFKKRKGVGAWLRDMTTSQAYQHTHAQQEEAFLDHDASHMVRDAAEALAENNAGTVRFCYTTQVIVVMEPDAARADTVARAIVKTLHEAGLSARIETVNAVEAFLGTLPGHGYPNVRRPLLSTTNVADLLPMTSVWPGLATNPSPYFPPDSPPLLWAKTQGSTPFRVNLHDSDVGHTLIVGRTGAGKSTLIGLLVAQFQRYPNAQVFVFDVGYSAWTLAMAAGAPHYDLAAGTIDALTFQPLAQIDHETERMWATEWLEMICALQGVTMTPPRRARLDAALRLLAKNAPEHRTLSELLVHLQEVELIAALKPYTMSGMYGRLLDASENSLLEGRYQVFELQHLMAMDDKILIPTALYLFHRMEQRLDGSPTLLVFEELWAALMRSVFADKIKQWLLTLRKRNAAVVLVAHSVGQLATAPHKHVLLESCPTRLFLPNPDATGREIAALYADVGLNPREIEIIARAIPKREYYFTSPRGRRLFELGLGPVALSVLSTPPGMTTDQMRQTIIGLTDQHGSQWPAEWLRQQQLPTWADRFIALHHHNTLASGDPNASFTQ